MVSRYRYMLYTRVLQPYLRKDRKGTRHGSFWCVNFLFGMFLRPPEIALEMFDVGMSFLRLYKALCLWNVRLRGNKRVQYPASFFLQMFWVQLWQVCCPTLADEAKVSCHLSLRKNSSTLNRNSSFRSAAHPKKNIQIYFVGWFVTTLWS